VAQLLLTFSIQNFSGDLFRCRRFANPFLSGCVALQGDSALQFVTMSQSLT
jgi:hypothetical protein